MWGRTIWDIPINSIKALSEKDQFDEILLAKPTLSKEKIREIVKESKKSGANILKSLN